MNVEEKLQMLKADPRTTRFKPEQRLAAGLIFTFQDAFADDPNRLITMTVSDVITLIDGFTGVI